jgi:hypothetical protein
MPADENTDVGWYGKDAECVVRITLSSRRGDTGQSYIDG